MKPYSFSLTLLSVSLAAALAYADPYSDYENSDLDAAIKAAQVKEEQGIVTEVGEKWYQKSTANSFPLPKLLNSEMDQLMIEGAISATAAGAGQIDGNEENKNKTLRDSALGRNLEEDALVDDNQTIELTSEPSLQNINFFLEESSATTQTGTLIIRDATSVGTVSATIR